MKSRNLLVSFIITLIGAILMVASVFMPYSTAINDHADYIDQNPDAMVIEEMDIKAEDIKNISMYEYANIYGNQASQLFGNSSDGFIYVILVALIGFFSLLVTLFALLKKPIAVIIFEILAYGVFSLQNWDYTDRGVIPSNSYDWGVGYYIFFIASVITVIGAILLIISKKRNNKQNSQAENETI